MIGSVGEKEKALWAGEDGYCVDRIGHENHCALTMLSQHLPQGQRRVYIPQLSTCILARQRNSWWDAWSSLYLCSILC